MEIDDPEVVAEVRAAFDRYERALEANDVATLNELFWCDPRTLRYGLRENLYGHEEIATFRSARPDPDVTRELTRTVITTFGRDAGTANTEYRRRGSGRMGRQSQTWVRMPEGWRIVAAHVSFYMPDA